MAVGHLGIPPNARKNCLVASLPSFAVITGTVVAQACTLLQSDRVHLVMPTLISIYPEV